MSDDHDNDMMSFNKTIFPGFQDKKIRLECLGDCGSKIMAFFLHETNLKNFTKYPCPRFHCIASGRGPKVFSQRLSFNYAAPDTFYSNSKPQFCRLFSNLISDLATTLSMGSIVANFGTDSMFAKLLVEIHIHLLGIRTLFGSNNRKLLEKLKTVWVNPHTDLQSQLC